MYTIAKNVQIVVALLKAHGVKLLVLSPGGTNAPFVRAVQDDPFFECYSIVDERSALYFAIGLSLSSGQRVATCCTSAQATRNYIPGLTEAFYKRVPILAITFSKHPQYTYQEYMQAPDQTSLPKDAVRKTYALPYISNEHDRLHCERLVNEAILELTHSVPAPVQLNIPMLDNELNIEEDIKLPEVKTIFRYNISDLKDLSIIGKKILIVVGENCHIDNEVLRKFANYYNVAIYVNQLSNLRNNYAVYGNLLLTQLSQEQFDEKFCPEILITIGGQTGDYPLFHKLADSKKNYEHWRISTCGDVVDTYDHLTRIFECSYYDFFDSLNGMNSIESSHEYLTTWNSAVSLLQTEMDLPLSNAFVAQQLHKLIPTGAFVNFSILNTLRIWNYFPIKNEVNCYCNVGAFGIDGCMSTFLGQSVATDNLCFLFIGDLSFYYDMNALGIRHIKNNVRIILINNQGGFEFKIGDDSNKNRQTDRFIAAAGHFSNSKGWASSNNFDYYEVREKESFMKVVPIILNKSERPIVIEILTDDIKETEAYKSIRQANDMRSKAEKLELTIKRLVKKILHF